MTRRAIEQHDKKDYTNHHPDAIRHPELVSGSVRGEGFAIARGEMLKQVQHDQRGEHMTRRNIAKRPQTIIKKKSDKAILCLHND